MLHQPKNVIVIVSDQHRLDCLGCTGHALIQTPNLDRLARGGVRFSHAFTPSPLCVPARSSFLLGDWPSRTGVYLNWDGEGVRCLPPDTDTWARRCAAAGHPFDYVGRWHVHPEYDPTRYGFSNFIGDEGYAEWRQHQGLAARPQDGLWQGRDDPSFFFGETDPHISPEKSRLAWLFDQTIARIDVREDEDRPIHLRLDCFEPHLPNIVPEPYASLYPPKNIPPWPGYGDRLEGKPFIQSQLRRNWNLAGWTWADWAPLVSRYLGEITLLDHQIGRLLQALEARKLLDDTLIVYTSDHGDMCGSHGMIDKLYVMYDDIVRVPLLMHWPKGIPAGHVCEYFTPHLIDLAATLCDACGASRTATPAALTAANLISLARGETPPPYDDIFATFSGNQFGLYTQRMVRDRRWKYIWNATAEDELYDLESDPGEHRNRAIDPECAPELKRLRLRLLAWMKEVNDPFLNPWNTFSLERGLKR